MDGWVVKPLGGQFSSILTLDTPGSTGGGEGSKLTTGKNSDTNTHTPTHAGILFPECVRTFEAPPLGFPAANHSLAWLFPSALSCFTETISQ